MTRMVALGPEQTRIAGKLRRQAADAEKDHPTMQVHGHLRDAATQLERGKHEAAERHLRAAIQSLTPLQLMRHGHLTDDEQSAGKEHMALLTRHLLNIKDISDTADVNRNLRAAMNAPNTTNSGGPGNEARGPAPVTAPAGHPKPARSWIAAGQQSAGPKLMSNTTDLAAWQHEMRGKHGEWMSAGGETHAYFGGGTHPGSFEHLNAIEDLGRRAASQVSDTGHQSPTMQTALHNVAISLARRDITGARTHMITAHWANEHEAGGMWTHELADLDKQIGQVPKQETGFRNRYSNPLTHQHPGKMVPTPAMLALSQIYQIAIELAADPVELSAQTARLAVTPAPRGKPGGPGLYDVKGLGHTPYLQQVVKALIEKRGMDPGKAYAIARAAIRKWMVKSKHPEVKAAAGAAEAGELAKQAQAHAHANTGQREILLFNPNHGPGGRFTTPSNAQQGKGKTGKGKLNTRATQMSNAARARAKGQLLQKAHADFTKAAALRAQIHALLAQLKGGSGATAASSGATQAASSSTKAAASATQASSSAKAGSSAASSSTKSASQIRSQVAGLRAQVNGLMAAGRAAQAQAARL